MKTILIVGATSAIAEETAKLYARQGQRLILWGRGTARLESIRRNLQILGSPEVVNFEMDLDACDRHPSLLEETVAATGGFDVVLLAHGVLPDQRAVQDDFEEMLPSLRTNFLSSVSLLTVFARYFESRKSGVIVCITSVAADRGRKSNYVYGSAKAGVSAFTDGLRGRLAASGVRVINIKPGMVDTPMTAGFKKGPLFASPRTVALGILKAIRKNKTTAYVPGYWRMIMTIVRLIPEAIFKKMNF